MTNKLKLGIIAGVGIIATSTACVGLLNNNKPVSKAVLTEKFNQAPQKIKNKYSLKDSSLIMVANDNPKDKLMVKIGGKDKFEPKIEMSRWDESSFSLKLKETEKGDSSLSFKDDKVVWNKGNIDIEFFETEDSYKMIWYLKKKPKTNKVQFEIESNDVIFYYQPALTQEEIDNGAFRPENVVGSYAVYAKTPKVNWVGGKEYKTGKVGHIYRPHLYDSNGLEAWGILHIENGIYSVEIPQEFSDKAVYPIKSNDDFGYKENGETEWLGGSAGPVATKFSSGAAGTITSITAYKLREQSPYTMEYGIFDSSGEFIKKSVQGDSPSTVGWLQLAISQAITNTDYYLGSWPDSTTYGYYDSGDTDQSWFTRGVDYGTWPDLSGIDKPDWKYSIYATYTPGGGGTESTPEVDSSQIIGYK